jgi:hypothetical protein
MSIVNTPSSHLGKIQYATSADAMSEAPTADADDSLVGGNAYLFSSARKTQAQARA